MTRRAVDWDQVSRDNYARELASPSAWIRTSNDLLAAAELLEPSVLEWWQSLSAWSKGEVKTPRKHGLHSVYMMLCAFAMENLCKSKLASSLTEQDGAQVQRGELPNRFKSHELHKLVAAAGLSIDADEEDLL